MTNQILRTKSNILAYGIILFKLRQWIVVEIIGETKSFFVFLKTQLIKIFKISFLNFKVNIQDFTLAEGPFSPQKSSYNPC